MNLSNKLHMGLVQGYRRRMTQLFVGEGGAYF